MTAWRVTADIDGKEISTVVLASDMEEADDKVYAIWRVEFNRDDIVFSYIEEVSETYDMFGELIDPGLSL